MSPRCSQVEGWGCPQATLDGRTVDRMSQATVHTVGTP